MEKKGFSKRFFLIVLSLFLVCLFILVLWQGFIKPESSLLNDSTIWDKKEAEIPENESFLMSMKSGVVVPFLPEDVMVFIPANSSSVLGKLEITLHDSSVLTESNASQWTRLEVVNVEVKDKQGKIMEVQDLPVPIEICFTLDEKTWEDYLSREDAYGVQFYTETSDGMDWELIETASYPVRKQICGITPHLSFFALAVDQSIPASPSSTPEPTKITIEETEIQIPVSGVTSTATKDNLPTSNPSESPVPTRIPTRTKTPTSVPTEDDLPIGS